MFKRLARSVLDVSEGADPEVVDCDCDAGDSSTGGALSSCRFRFILPRALATADVEFTHRLDFFVLSKLNISTCSKLP